MYYFVCFYFVVFSFTRSLSLALMLLLSLSLCWLWLSLVFHFWFILQFNKLCCELHSPICIWITVNSCFFFIIRFGREPRQFVFGEFLRSCCFIFFFLFRSLRLGGISLHRLICVQHVTHRNNFITLSVDQSYGIVELDATVFLCYHRHRGKSIYWFCFFIFLLSFGAMFNCMSLPLVTV